MRDGLPLRSLRAGLAVALATAALLTAAMAGSESVPGTFQEGAHKRLPSLTWLVLEAAGPRDETGPPLLLHVSEAARRAALRELRRETTAQARLSPTEMRRLASDLAKRRLWPNVRPGSPRPVAPAFRLRLGGGQQAPTTSHLPATQARTLLLAMRNRLLESEQAVRVVTEFAALHGWR